MKRRFLTLFLILFLSVFGYSQEHFIMKFNKDSNNNYNENIVDAVLLNKYQIVEDYCINEYFPSLKDKNILVGEDVNGFLNREKTINGLDTQAASFIRCDGVICIVFNGNYFFDKDAMIELMCHELAHFSSGTSDHNDIKYQNEAKRLKSYGIDIIATYTTDYLFKYYIGDLK